MNGKKIAAIIAVAVLGAGAGGYLYWDNSYNFTTGPKGKTLNSKGYFADFENFNGEDSFEIQLEKGEKIHLDAHIEKGNADFKFFRHGEDKGFSICGIIDTDTDLTADESSRYVIELKAKHAKGEINITFDENRKDKTVYSSNNVDVGEVNADIGDVKVG